MSKQPVSDIWCAIRDRAPDLAKMLDDVDSINVLERTQLPHGRVRLVNEWRATPRLLSSLKPVLGTDTVIWLDRAEWNQADWVCRWRIEPQFLEGRLQCHGVSSYQPAMGGRGSKITFEGEFTLAHPFGTGPGRLIPSAAAQMLESIVTVLIPKNFRRMVEAADRL